MINAKGYWEHDTLANHYYDPSLIAKIIGHIRDLKSVADLGCGHGLYTKRLNEEGFECEGFDGNPNTRYLTGGDCKVLDLSTPAQLKKYDCVLCLEVGEHIPAEYEQVFLDNITNHADKIIILSWAIPNQPGHGHVNCKPNSYIIEKIEEKGFKYDSIISMVLRDSAMLPWFKNTIMVFDK